MAEARRWWGWGVRSQEFPLKPEAQQALFQELGVDPRSSNAAEPALPQLPNPKQISPPCKFADDERARLECATGRSTPDLLRLRFNRLLHAPDAVAYPTSDAEVKAVLQWAADERVAVVPFGGGTSVVGGVEALAGEQRAVLALNLKCLQAVLEIDEVSGLAKAQAGILGPALEQALGARGFSLGHFPQSFEFSTLGGWVATRSAGQNSTLYGKIENLTAAVKMIAPTGEIRTRCLPASASGPEMREVMVGSEGTLGVITEATVRVHPLPSATQYASYFFRNFEAGFATTREIMHAGLRPAVFRLSDETETRLLMTLGGADRSKGVKLLRMLGKSPYLEGCHMMLGFEGEPSVVKAQARAARQIARRNDGMGIGSGPGHRWERERFELPYFRDTLLDMGIAVDTFETAAPWAALPGLHRALQKALPVPLILAHISHAYSDGASLYITWLADAPDPDQALELWAKVKKIAGEVIQQHGAAISHHHAIGMDHRPWMAEEKGSGQIQLLRAVKQSCDPMGIMNPGKLIPDV